MSLVISKIRCNNPNYKGQKNANGKSLPNSAIANTNHLIYIATRPGVSLDMDLKYFSSEMLQNESYNNIKKSEKFQYKVHGLFGNINTNNLHELSHQMYKMTSSGKTIFKGIISLQEKDAIELGYDNRIKWEHLLKKKMPDIAQELGIPFTELQYVAAVHMESGHPHVHYMLWSKNDSRIIKPFIKKEQQLNVLRHLTKEIGQDKIHQLSMAKTFARDYILDFNKTNISNITDVMIEIEKMKHNFYHKKIPSKILTKDFDQLCSSLNEIKDSLPSTGRITYQLVSPTVKQKVDALTEQILKLPNIKKQYALFLKNAADLAEVYKTDPDNASKAIDNASSDIKKRIGNQILKETKNLRTNLDLLESNLHKLEKENLNNQHLEEYSKLKKEQMLCSFGTKLFNNIFQTINTNQHPYSIYDELKRYRSQSKQAKKEILEHS